ncbi:hypothetical protein appser2_9460 [Actinobacillus pleuropneumoniae serovar 2 str. S1536]|nr:hypothetical protein appser2_9460 [Actinobacillus pleuropneumoniae serovar 2 str. S1536]
MDGKLNPSSSIAVEFNEIFVKFSMNPTAIFISSLFSKSDSL